MTKPKEILILKIAIKLMRVHQFWPKNNKMENLNRFFYVRLVFLLLVASWIVFAGSAYLIRTLIDNVQIPLVDDTETIASLAGISYLLITYCVGLDKKISLYEDLSDFSRFGKPPNFDLINRHCDCFTLFLFTFCLVCVWLNSLNRIVFERASCLRDNLENNSTRVCGLYASVYLPFEFDYFPLKQVVLLFQLYSMQMLILPGPLISTTEVACTQLIKNRLQHLEGLLRHVFEIRDVEIARKSFRNCVEYHQDILHLAQRTSDCYSLSMAAQVIWGPTMGVLGYHASKEISLGAFIFCLACIVTTFTLCFSGEVIHSACLNVALVAYDTRWYDAPVDLQKDLTVLIRRAQKPVLLRGGPLVSYHFVAFVGVLKSGYSVMMLLKHLHE